MAASVSEQFFAFAIVLGRSKRSSTSPNLIDIQKRSYEKFLQANVPQEEREDIGLQGVFKSVLSNP